MINFPGMNNVQLELLISKIGTIIEGQPGYWQFQFNERQLVCITDETHNRMRVMTPVASEDDLDEEELKTILEANFDRAMDAKYALSNSLLWSVYTHPLSELSNDQFLDSISQVEQLANTFGTTYSSSDLKFRGGR